MKKSYAKILALVPLFALSACHSPKGKITGIGMTTPEIHPTNAVDTMRVTGVFNLTEGFVFSQKQYKYIKCVDRNNRVIEYRFDVKQKPKNDVAWVERGDTILMIGKWFVKNITQERLQSEFVKGR